MPAWTALLAVWFLHERMTPSRLGVVVLGLIGVLVILRPGIAAFNPAAILVLLAAFGYAITMITTKKLTMTETTFGIVFWMAVIQFPLSLIGQRPCGFFPFRSSSHFARNRGRRRRAHVTLLPEQRLPVRRRDVGGPAGFHAYSADRRGRLGVLRRTARYFRAAWRADHYFRRASGTCGPKSQAQGSHRQIFPTRVPGMRSSILQTHGRAYCVLGPGARLKPSRSRRIPRASGLRPSSRRSTAAMPIRRAPTKSGGRKTRSTASNSRSTGWSHNRARWAAKAPASSRFSATLPRNAAPLTGRSTSSAAASSACRSTLNGSMAARPNARRSARRC